MVRLLPVLFAAALAVLPASAPRALDANITPAFDDTPARGPAQARGVVVWSHGRSLDSEDMMSRSPLYLRALRDAGWDVVRFERRRVGDTLPASSQALAARAEALKSQGYRRVVLAGQSFGAFLSLMAAGRSEAVDAVVATAPAAFGNHSEAFSTWRMNATQLYNVLREVRRAKVALFFFQGDDFDPGGRADRSGEILAAEGVEALIIDQPAELPGHNAGATGLFARRYGSCILRFAEEGRTPSPADCEQPWGAKPAAEMLSPAASTPGISLAAVRTRSPLERRWYGYYLNGREVMLSIDAVDGERVRATYTLGAGVDPDQKPETNQRIGRLDGEELVFDEPGRNVLRFRPRHDGRLAGTWTDARDGGRLQVVLRPIE
ncbi:alpha/beta hydrolase [Arenibaculum pallidiluteum]|uniref:alpha/beta hydrolase n=1 Tax=Arenibaculum pallidiluteum TaxID=2812559 RepID=UPI001A9770BB|nr:alpha/beta hydrolase [Arenibaculum pallidiluteum]